MKGRRQEVGSLGFRPPALWVMAGTSLTFERTHPALPKLGSKMELPPLKASWIRRGGPSDEVRGALGGTNYARVGGIDASK